MCFFFYTFFKTDFPYVISVSMSDFTCFADSEPRFYIALGSYLREFTYMPEDGRFDPNGIDIFLGNGTLKAMDADLLENMVYWIDGTDKVRMCACAFCYQVSPSNMSFIKIWVYAYMYVDAYICLGNIHGRGGGGGGGHVRMWGCDAAGTQKRRLKMEGQLEQKESNLDTRIKRSSYQSYLAYFLSFPNIYLSNTY